MSGGTSIYIQVASFPRIQPLPTRSSPLFSDPDGDSEMLSSSESSEVEASNPQTPTGQAKAIRPSEQPQTSELSPPGSQTATRTESVKVQQLPGTGNEVSSSTYTILGTDDQSEDKQSDIDSLGEPGSSWMTRQADEDYHRALETVVDKDFSLSMGNLLVSSFCTKICLLFVTVEVESYTC